MHFLKHVSYSTLNYYVQILVMLMVSSKNIVTKYYFWEGEQRRSHKTYSKQIKTILYGVSLNEHFQNTTASFNLAIIAESM